MCIAENVLSVKTRISEAAKAAGRSPEDIVLVAATKMNNSDRVREAIAAGIAVCGENRVQELLEKNAQNAYNGAKKHFIGHLQTNKVRQIVGICDFIQSVDSSELLLLIDKKAGELGIIQDVLIEINIGDEQAKSGILPGQLPDLLALAATLPSLRVLGLMAIPPISSFSGSNRVYFAAMHKLFIDNSAKKYDNISMDFLSMGMSDDFEEAIAEGANMVRVGSAIFGARECSRQMQ
ncbi:MAG: YggS family pyridoxal phosphate-dependent enzyme [Clostridia bacterium]|nr:YggS family pyridoxal phosphate-dependent enzyme [Clostridia bacterium]